MVEFNELKITQVNGEIIKIEHGDFDVDFNIVDQIEFKYIIHTIQKFIDSGDGLILYPLWSDCDFEEASDDYYISVDKYTGAIDKSLITGIEKLVKVLYAEDSVVYRIVCEDNLL